MIQAIQVLRFHLLELEKVKPQLTSLLLPGRVTLHSYGRHLHKYIFLVGYN